VGDGTSVIYIFAVDVAILVVGAAQPSSQQERELPTQKAL
jgi:hypothetical protein